MKSEISPLSFDPTSPQFIDAEAECIALGLPVTSEEQEAQLKVALAAAWQELEKVPKHNSLPLTEDAIKEHVVTGKIPFMPVKSDKNPNGYPTRTAMRTVGIIACCGALLSAILGIMPVTSAIAENRIFLVIAGVFFMLPTIIILCSKIRKFLRFIKRIKQKYIYRCRKEE